ncbi:hypothetical protein FQA39_LY01215 [Lamprigera yunnana]|nr:hypothetical protein FQA39_LY01215 [Lamprigera yunnana]
MLLRFSVKIITSVLNNNLRRCSTKIRSFEEIRIPVPWGYIAGKWWGPQDKRPILVNHGWQDNCGSFDRLIPLLPSDIAILAIDFPGHGLSTHIPLGMVYRAIDGVWLYKYIRNYFEWDKISLLGHCMGAAINFIYAVLYVDTVDFIINIDVLKFPVVEKNAIKHMNDSIEHYGKCENRIKSKKRPPTYTFKSLEQRLHEATKKSVALENCKYLLKRNTAPSREDPSKYYVTCDQRLKFSFLGGVPQKISHEGAHKLTCPFLFCKSTRGPYVDDKTQVHDVLEVLTRVNKDFEFHMIDGTHHVHLNRPENVAKLLLPFIEKYNVHNRDKGGLKQEMKVSVST